MNDKLLAIQSKLKAPKNLTNSFGGYKYRSCEDILEAVKPLLKEQGLTLVLTDEVVNIGSHNYVKADAILQGDTEIRFTVSAFAREAETKKGMDDAQITGAASSYARKYALNGLFAIDDTKDADSKDNTNYKAPVKSAPKTESSIATDAQRKLIADLLMPLGFYKPEEIKNYLATEYGINELLSKADASMIIEDLKGE